jgi:hypothetical protein
MIFTPLFTFFRKSFTTYTRLIVGVERRVDDEERGVDEEGVFSDGFAGREDCE